MKKVPWKDYAGNILYEGDIIIHPDGTWGEILFLKKYKDIHDQWRVKYSDKIISRLSLQIGDKGQAMKLSNLDFIKQTSTATKSVYCKNCRLYNKKAGNMVTACKEHPYFYYNIDNHCQYYKRKWWKFWK